MTREHFLRDLQFQHQEGRSYGEDSVAEGLCAASAQSRLLELLSCRLGKAKQVSHRKPPGLSSRKHRPPARLDSVGARVGFQKP